MVERLLNVLTYTEIQAVSLIYDAIQGEDGLIVVSNLTNNTVATKSVFVSAQKLLEAAGVIETRSLGRKGTYIEILEHEVFKEVAANGRLI